ncbi:hypothetical protein FKM82_003566 [Ascaphus truei]
MLRPHLICSLRMLNMYVHECERPVFTFLSFISSLPWRSAMHAPPTGKEGVKCRVGGVMPEAKRIPEAAAHTAARGFLKRACSASAATAQTCPCSSVLPGYTPGRKVREGTFQPVLPCYAARHDGRTGHVSACTAVLRGKP